MAETLMPRAYGVSEINNYLREYLTEDELLTDLLVQGELTSYKCHSSGHIYFTLSEGGCGISGVMFRQQAAAADYLPQAGLEVVVWGSVSLYERDGRAQLYARAFLPVGAGKKGDALALLKEKLAGEGLFEAGRKRALPMIPQSLGVVTADHSAAWADIQSVAHSRWPGLPLRLYPTIVQGAEAPAAIAAALAKADQGGHSVLIVGRGGGANEDLAAFNTELVARAVANTLTPLISAVGHEIDLSLADLAADFRAATPSHAAALAVPQLTELQGRVSRAEQALRQALERGLRQRAQELLGLERRLQLSAGVAARQRRAQLGLLAARLQALSPLNTLARGYAVCRNQQGQTLRRASEVDKGERVQICLAEGGLSCVVEETGSMNICEELGGEE